MGWFKLADSTGLIRPEKFGSKSSCFLHKLEVHQKKWAVLMAWRLMYIISKRDTLSKCWSSQILLIRCLCKPYSGAHPLSQSQDNMFPFLPDHQLNWQGHFRKVLVGCMTRKFNLSLEVSLFPYYNFVSLAHLYFTPSVSYLCYLLTHQHTQEIKRR